MTSKNETKTVTTSGGVGVAGLLGIVFIVLKLTGIIAWSWLWVLAPFWIPATLFVVVVLPVLVILFIGAVAKALK